MIIHPFEALSQASRGRGESPAVEAMLRILPAPRAFIPGTRWRAIRSTDLALTRSTRSNSASAISSSAAGRWVTRALLTGVKLAEHVERRCGHARDPGIVGDIGHRPFRPEPITSAAAASAFTSAIITRAPSARNFRAIPAPKPEAPPVTSAVLPSSRMARGLPARRRVAT